jgi:predicted MPP superfamily phosphohydrolase
MKKPIIFHKRWTLLCLLLGLISCATSRYPHFKGIGRIKTYVIEHEQIPPAFDGFCIAFLADFHYKSAFGEKELHSCLKALKYIAPDAVMLGGDYQEGIQYVAPLFQHLSLYQAPYGTFAVLGNNDMERCPNEIRAEMKRRHIRLLEQEVDTIKKEGQRLLVAGILDPFNLKKYGESPTLKLRDEDYVILLTHTPDYAEDVPITHTDLALAGHTHGGQVTFAQLIVPHTGSKYGKRFLSRLNYNSQGIPVLTTNGLGTSKHPIRLFSPSEIVVIRLKRINKNKE